MDGNDAADPLRDLVRAYAYSELPALSDAERARWEERYAALCAELGRALPPKLEFAECSWFVTLGSLRKLQTAMQDAAGPLDSRYSREERRILEAYAEAHVDILRAICARGSL